MEEVRRRLMKIGKKQARVVDGFTLLREMNIGSMIGENIFEEAIGVPLCEEKVREALGFLERETVEPAPWVREGRKPKADECTSTQ